MIYCAFSLEIIKREQENKLLSSVYLFGKANRILSACSEQTVKGHLLHLTKRSSGKSSPQS